MTVKVVVTHEIDECPDYSYLGEISRNCSDTALKRPVTDLPYDMMRNYRDTDFVYYEPMNSIEESRKYFHKRAYVLTNIFQFITFTNYIL